MADEAKSKGNAAFSSGHFELAIRYFTEAILSSPTNHVLYSNRSAAHASLQHYALAFADARTTVELKPDWPKGYSRLGAAHLGLRNHQKAIDAYEKGLKLDPTNEALKSGLSDARAAASRSRPPPSRGASSFGNMSQRSEAWTKMWGPANELERDIPSKPDAQKGSGIQRRGNEADRPSKRKKTLPEREKKKRYRFYSRSAHGGKAAGQELAPPQPPIASAESPVDFNVEALFSDPAVPAEPSALKAVELDLLRSPSSTIFSELTAPVERREQEDNVNPKKQAGITPEVEGMRRAEMSPWDVEKTLAFLRHRTEELRKENVALTMENIELHVQMEAMREQADRAKTDFSRFRSDMIDRVMDLETTVGGHSDDLHGICGRLDDLSKCITDEAKSSNEKFNGLNLRVKEVERLHPSQAKGTSQVPTARPPIAPEDSTVREDPYDPVKAQGYNRYFEGYDQAIIHMARKGYLRPEALTDPSVIHFMSPRKNAELRYIMMNT